MNVLPKNSQGSGSKNTSKNLKSILDSFKEPTSTKNTTKKIPKPEDKVKKKQVLKLVGNSKGTGKLNAGLSRPDLLEITQHNPSQTTKSRMGRADEPYFAGNSTTKRAAQKESLSKFFLMDYFSNSRSKSNLNNDTSENQKGNSLEIKLKTATPAQKQVRKSKSPKEADKSNMFLNKSA